MRDKKTFPDPARWSHHTHAGTDCFNPDCPVNIEQKQVGHPHRSNYAAPSDLDADVERVEQLALNAPHATTTQAAWDIFPRLIAERKALREENAKLIAWQKAAAEERIVLRERLGQAVKLLQSPGGSMGTRWMDERDQFVASVTEPAALTESQEEVTQG